MKATQKTTFRLTAVAAALLAAYGSAMAQQDPEVMRLITPSADDYLSVGVGNWDRDRRFQGQFDGMWEGDAYLLFDGQVRRRDDANGGWFTLDIRNLGLDTREVRLGLERQGNMGGYIDFNQIPRKYPWTITTNLAGPRTDTPAINTMPPSYELNIGTRRDRVGFGFFKHLNELMPGLQFKVDFRSEEKTGEQNYSIGSDPLFTTQLIDSTINLLDAHFAYSKDKLQLRGGYYGTWYDTNVEQIIAAGGSTGQTPLSQPLDSSSWQLYFDGGYSFTPTTRGTFKVKYGEASVDEGLPIRPVGGPPFVGMSTKLDGKIETTLVEVGISSRPMPKLSIVGKLRYYDVDEKTPVYSVIGNNATGAVTVHSTPQSIETVSGKIEGTYRLPMGFSVIGSIDGKDQDRSKPQFLDEIYVPYRTSLKEWNYGIQVRRGLSETINGSLGYIYSKRDGGSYSPTNHPTAFAENQIRPWNVADRDRDRWRLKLDWTPTDRLAFTGVFEDARDDYPKNDGRPYGMDEGSGNFYSLDATYQISDGWQLVGFYAYDQTKAERRHGRWDRITDIFEGVKDASLKDKNDTVGLSLIGNVNSKWKIGADVLYTRARSSYNESWISAGPGVPLPGPYPQAGGVDQLAALPDIETKLTRLRLYADYAVHKRGSLRFDVIYEDWRTNDWSYNYSDGTPWLRGTANGTGDQDGTYFTQKSPQKSTFFGVRYKYMLD
jgi:MtrB/PioB family decaheme-associated outer membrane protein